MPSIDTFLRSHGLDFVLRRDSAPDRTEIGLMNRENDSQRVYVGFRPGTDVKEGDTLTNPAGETFYVTEATTAFFMKKPYEVRAFYETEKEHRALKDLSPSVRIENAYGINIGSGNTSVINFSSALSDLKQTVENDTSEDKESMEKIVSLLEMIVENQVSPSKGLFSRFSGVLERNSWLSNAVASTLLGWLMSHIG